MSNLVRDNVTEYIHHYENFKILKNRNDSELLLNEIKRSFTTINNPYMFLLHCFNYNKDVYYLKPKSLCFAIIEGFKLYAKENEHNLPEISIELQKDAFLVSKKVKHNALRSILKIFNFQNSGNIFLQALKNELKCGNYSFVCNACICMNLQSEFTSYELLIPLYFLGLSGDLKSLLMSSGSQSIIAFLCTLDKYVGKEYDLSEILDLVPDKTSMKSKSKTEIMKYAFTTIKDYNINPEICPNIMYNHTFKVILYLFKKYFDLKEITQFAFCLFLSDFTKKIPVLESEVLNLFKQKDDEKTLEIFLKVMETFPNKIMDVSMQERLDRNEDTSNSSYYQLAINKHLIYYVANLKDFEQSIKKINSYSLVGIDCEWHPTTYIGSKEQLALIQIAVEDAVYIFDMYVLSEIFTTEQWDQLGDIFSSNLLKLTYGFRNDSKILININKTFAFHIKRINNILDLNNLKESLILYNPSLFSYNRSNFEKGLSELVYLCFGQPLNKIYQYSYWIYRPLSVNEIKYAAIDAHCLIEIKNYLDGISSEMGIEDWTKLKNLPPIQSKTKIEAKKLPYNDQPISVHEIKFVCDTMVQGLGRLLRHCGIDTRVLHESERHDRCISIYKTENRIILTKGSVYNRLTKYIPKESVHLLKGETARLQLEEVVNVFNIKVTEGDIFGRCSDCNYDNYLIVPKDIIYKMKALTEDKKTPASGADVNEWTSVKGGKVNCVKQITGREVPIKIDDIPVGILDKISLIYICGGCGKCYWDGSHYEMVLHNMLKSLVL